jgi:hypothetical protein
MRSHGANCAESFGRWEAQSFGASGNQKRFFGLRKRGASHRSARYANKMPTSQRFHRGKTDLFPLRLFFATNVGIAIVPWILRLKSTVCVEDFCLFQHQVLLESKFQFKNPFIHCA